MFSQACVKNSVHRRGCLADTLRQADTPWQADTPQQVDTPRADPPLWQADTHHPPPCPQQMAAAADGTHPSGMHSYCYCVFQASCAAFELTPEEYLSILYAHTGSVCRATEWIIHGESGQYNSHSHNQYIYVTAVRGRDPVTSGNSGTPLLEW